MITELLLLNQYAASKVFVLKLQKYVIIIHGFIDAIAAVCTLYGDSCTEDWAAFNTVQVVVRIEVYRE